MAVSIHPDKAIDAFLLLKEIADGKWKSDVGAQFRERAIEIVKANDGER